MPRHPNAVERTDKRTWSAKHYQNPNGSFTAEISTGAKHYRATPGGSFLEKKQGFKVGTGPNEFVSDESAVTMATYRTGAGSSRRWWVEFRDKLTNQGIRFALDNTALL